MLLKDKVVIVTGGAQGIGREIALGCAKAGANVVICDVNADALAQTKQEISELNVDVLDLQTDITDMEKVQQMTDKVLDKFKRVDILINNAGITRDSLLMRMKEEDWDLVIKVNLKGSFNCIKSVSKPMMKQRYGKIVNIASIIGIIGNFGQANYAASKAGIIGLTKTAAKELASRNINVNAIAPGYIDTAMTAKLSEDVKEAMLNLIPLKRLGTPSDVAKLAVFLASDDSDYITGQVIQVDGGMVM